MPKDIAGMCKMMNEVGKMMCEKGQEMCDMASQMGYGDDSEMEEEMDFGDTADEIAENTSEAPSYSERNSKGVPNNKEKKKAMIILALKKKAS